MSNIPVYMIVNLIITDKDEYHKYEKGFFGKESNRLLTLVETFNNK